MRLTKLQSKTLEIFARLHEEGMPWVRIIDLLAPEHRSNRPKQGLMRNLLGRLQVYKLIERNRPARYNNWIVYRMADAGSKALEEHRAKVAKASAPKQRQKPGPKPKPKLNPILKPKKVEATTIAALTPGCALYLMQLVTIGGNRGLLTTRVAGLRHTDAPNFARKLAARGLCERLTEKPPHVYRATSAGREALAAYLAAARHEVQNTPQNI
jgi:DNA-binding PadR family transcriptional regulator